MLVPQVSPPLFEVGPEDPLACGADVLALPVLLGAEDGPALGPGAAALVDLLPLDLFAALESDRADGTPGQVTRVFVGGLEGLPAGLDLLLLVGVGTGEPADLRRAGAGIARATKGRTTLAATVPLVGDDHGLRAFVEGVTLGSFGYALRSTDPTAPPVGRVVLCGTPDGAVLARATAVATAAWQARTLATVPSNIKSPQWFVEQARPLATAAGLAVEVYDEQRLAADGFGGILAVGAASATPPRLLRLDYTPAAAGRRTPHVVLVGKGITFDSGGLSIKPGELMASMKRDMTGGAVVLAVLSALAAVDCPVKVTGLVPLAENVISGNAMRPGDVITQYGGRTTEVTNTDAEGRLVLADAMAFAVAQLKPDALVDVATLTGAAKVALGQRLGGIFTNRDALDVALRTAGQAAGEPFWRLPLADVYEERLASKVADADNAPGSAAAIVAALFLQHFAGGLPWAHLDIAPVGDAVEDAWEWTAGPTGFGVRALLYWLEQREPLAGVIPSPGG